jgi:hypothetical protein
LIPTSLVVEEDSYERDPALPAGQGDDSGLPDRIAGRHSALPQSGARLAGAPNGSGLAITQAFGEADADDLDRPGLPVGSEVPADAIASSYPGPAATFVATEHGDVTGVVEPEPARLSWSDETVRISEHEPVRLSWSSEQSSPSVSSTPAEAASEREPAKVTWSDESVTTGEREAVKLSWSEVSANQAEPGPKLAARSEGGSNGRKQESATGWPSAGYGFAEAPGSAGSSAAAAAVAGSAGVSDGAVTKTDVSELGLPVRVRQASLAPQLRKAPSPPPADANLGTGFYSGATGAPGAARRPGDSDIDPFAPRRSAAQPTSDSGSHLASPEAARSTMSALQRGWQLGRSEAEHGTSPGDAPSGYSPSGYPPGDSGPYQIPATSATPGSARGSNPAGSGATDPDPTDSADQHDNE